ncbi:hypothetical protein CCL45_gp02 [Sulfolobus islandicus rod-shaped virus 5]|uniref:Uncharacterized protein n=2 Tax=Usarudivirus SIRV5 TaxID=2846591 RepID=A0A1X9SKG5_9VIRU|nr:hypothetical protein CCL43_gp02 [Sulfolobus islandicus rod-shaped virus 7]YP_009362612.1 hypothetical protein CCL45_gp02 [Sulfolobus islandicus rod-shaped virus 5]YP_009362864.1 hypothetical protein CCL44_gp02 [Sulfolobus islandicus rod-shaped phage 6]ARQ96572.1 hypothetical protein [Sulfolobus islandicus rod-shaped virus 7]ARQ96624.1 hypothetical protein [Sulfolobus islandicus rod-shaped virus 5]ARQ96731.1 hypothetical protein [Sulfolobus islandicus rod-shaped phage 6]
MAQEKSQNSFKEITQQEINVSFSIQKVQVQSKYDEYTKLISQIFFNGNEINFQKIDSEKVDVIKILQKIAKLYKIMQEVDNEKVIQGSKEEILKLIALLIYNLQ